MRAENGMTSPDKDWTTEPPTERGWYWWRYEPSHDAIPLQITMQSGTPHVIGIGVYEALTCHGEWWPERINEPV